MLVRINRRKCIAHAIHAHNHTDTLPQFRIKRRLHSKGIKHKKRKQDGKGSPRHIINRRYNKRKPHPRGKGMRPFRVICWIKSQYLL
jgi:hypothetical protein